MTREGRAKEMATHDLLKPITVEVGHEWAVPSQRKQGQLYTVTHEEHGLWGCTCPDNTYRKVTCKHILLVEMSGQ